MGGIHQIDGRGEGMEIPEKNVKWEKPQVKTI